MSNSAGDPPSTENRRTRRTVNLDALFAEPAKTPPPQSQEPIPPAASPPPPSLGEGPRVEGNRRTRGAAALDNLFGPKKAKAEPPTDSGAVDPEKPATVSPPPPALGEGAGGEGNRRTRGAALDDLFGPRKAKTEPPADSGEAGPEKPAAVSPPPPSLGEGPRVEGNRRTRGAAALDDLFGPKKTTERPPERNISRKGDLLAGLERTQGGAQAAEAALPGEDGLRLKINPEIESYLPPDLWRKITGLNPRRGVLINAHDRLRSTLYQLSTYLPAHLVQEKMRRPVPGLVSGKMLSGSLLFSDVSGFTALSERLALLGPQGAEQLTSIMNRYFSAMLDIISWSGGVLMKFAGDATLVYFPEQKRQGQAHWALRAGQRMLNEMSSFANIQTPTEKISLKMKIGIGSGEFLAASIGSAERMEYDVLGPAVTLTMGAEGAANGAGELIVDEATAAILGSAHHYEKRKGGYLNVVSSFQQALDSFEIKAEQRRARGATPWDAEPQAIVAQMEVAMQQIKAIVPYLAQELVERIVAHARHRQMDSEFRPVTTMFCNFTGPEALLDLWGSSGVSRLTSILSAYFNAMHEAIHRYGGIVTRIDPYSKGAKMLILFGAPVSHEDDPQRAVSAALTMNVELDILNERLLQKHARHLPPTFKGPLIQHRIGVTYGEIFAGQVGSPTRREYTVMGDDVNLAARLMGAGRFGQILLSPHIYDAVADTFVVTRLNPIKVKGKSKPIPLVQVDGPADNMLLNRAHQRGPLVGRENGLNRAGRLLGEALQGKCSLLTLQGPAGIGKSHLADELLKRAEAQSARALAVQCRSYNQDTPYAGWGALLRSLAGITSIDVAQVHLEKLDRLVSSQHLPAADRSSLGALMGIRPPQPQAAEPSEDSPGEQDLFAQLKRGKSQRKARSLDILSQLDDQQVSDAGQVWQPIAAILQGEERRRTYQAVVDLFNRLLANGPLVIFFEDAHWLDEASRDLLLYLLENHPSIPLLILLARRDEDKTLARAGSQIRLDTFDVQETTNLVAYILISELAPLIHQQSNGNPLFIEQISRWIQRTRGMSAKDLQDILQSSDILQKLVLSSVESLPEAPREVARVASVVGQEFRIGEVQAALGSSVDPVTLSNHLRTLSSARLINLLEAGVDGRYSFQQALVRDILYNSLSFEKRRELHAKVADYLSAPRDQRSALRSKIAAFLDESPAENPQEIYEIIGQHNLRAERFLPAAHNFLDAARLARQRLDQAHTAANAQQALNALERLAPEALDGQARRLKIEACLIVGDMQLQAQNYAAAVSAYEIIQGDLLNELSAAQNSVWNLRLALILPAVNREAEALARLEAPGVSFTEFKSALRAWLSRRSGQADAALRLEEAQAAQSASPCLKALLPDLAGDYTAAHAAYLDLDRPAAAALALLRLGDTLLVNDPAQALAYYRQAAAEWEALPAGPERQAGLALAVYRQAEAQSRLKAENEARSALNRCLEQLSQAPAAIRSEGRALVKAAFKLLDAALTTKQKGKPPPQSWPAWRWQSLDDSLTISLLFVELETLDATSQ